MKHVRNRSSAKHASTAVNSALRVRACDGSSRSRSEPCGSLSRSTAGLGSRSGDRNAKNRHRIPSGVSIGSCLAVASVRFAGWQSYYFVARIAKKSRFYSALRHGFLMANLD